MIEQRDLSLLNALTVDVHADPNFELIKYCLIWPDERPCEHLSREGREFLTDLWIVRGFIHRSVPVLEWGLDPQYFIDVWAFGLANAAEWPGFTRLVLSEADRAYLDTCLDMGESAV